MRYSLTDGSVIDIPEMCSCCNMTTGGQHESHCPLSDVREAKDTEQEYLIKGKDAFKIGKGG